MFEKTTKVIFLKSISGQPEPRYGLSRPFAFQPGDEREIDSGLARAWTLSGVCTAPENVSIRQLLDLRLPA
jgi:hypothetical protein